MDTIKSILDGANGVIWNWPGGLPLMVVLLLGTGVFLTLRLGFINLRGFRHALRVVRGVYDNPDDPGDITHFQALTTALSATVGIGNIAGVATAIHYGGPGALVWMWLTALFGMTTKYTECTLACHYRRDNPDGSVSGGPMYYIDRGLGPAFKPLAIFFAICAFISSFGSGNAVQAFTMADQFRSDLGLPTWLTGGISAAVVGLVILGGIKRIGSFASRVMPAMAILYFVGVITVLALHHELVPGAFVEIVTSAFSPTAAVAGFSGATFVFTLTWGVKRGLFSNEAGQGSAPIAHAAAKTEEPVREGAVALLEPFVDTLIVCTLTGVMIVTMGLWKDKRESTYPVAAQSAITVMIQSDRCDVEQNSAIPDGCKIARQELPISAGRVQGAALVINHGTVDGARIHADQRPVDGVLRVDEQSRPTVLDAQGKPIRASVTGQVLQNGSPLTAWALERGLAQIFPHGALIVTFCVFLFAISTAIGWSYYGDRAVQYLFRHIGDGAATGAVWGYKGVFVLMHFLGAIFSLEVVWGFGDAALGLMSLPNLIAIVSLSGTVARLTREYFARDHVPFKDRDPNDDQP